MSDYFDRVETQLAELVGAGAHRSRWAPARPRARRSSAALRRPRRFSGPLALAGSAAIAVAVVIVALLSLHHGGPAASSAQPGAARIDPSLVANYRLLRRPRTAGDGLPGGLGASAVRRGLFPSQSDWLDSYGPPPRAASLGLLPELTRRTTIPGTGYRAWIIPGRHGMCWLTQNGPVPDPAICVGSLRHRPGALIDGPWTDVIIAGHGIIGLVTDRVTAVVLVTAHARRRLPLHDGFYVSPLPTGDQRLIAETRTGSEPLYPQKLPAPTRRTLGSDGRAMSRASHPEVVLTGTRGLTVALGWEMTCSRTPTGDDSRGEQWQRPVRVPAVVPISFPGGSKRLAYCYGAATITDSVHAHGIAAVSIALR